MGGQQPDKTATIFTINIRVPDVQGLDSTPLAVFGSDVTTYENTPHYESVKVTDTIVGSNSSMVINSNDKTIFTKSICVDTAPATATVDTSNIPAPLNAGETDTYNNTATWSASDDTYYGRISGFDSAILYIDRPSATGAQGMGYWQDSFRQSCYGLPFVQQHTDHKGRADVAG